jgi:GGDEF domain-containing protein
VFARASQLFTILVAVSVGFALGSGPLGDWIPDFWNFICITWLTIRAARESSGSFTLLIAGFLIGQGLYLALQHAIRDFRTRRIRTVEAVAAWDPALQIATRFGLHRYLEQCARWASEDPTNRTPSLALFKIRGLGNLNERRGTLEATRLLKRIAAELRSAAIPDGTPHIGNWLAMYFPRPLYFVTGSTPKARLASRWSGGTFALAFRQLDAVQAVSVTRDVAAWIEAEFATLDRNNEPKLSLISGIAIGCSNVTPRSLTAAAFSSLDSSRDESLVTVAHDPSDLRAETIAKMSDVRHVGIAMNAPESDATASTSEATFQHLIVAFSKKWGIAIGCIAVAFAVLQLGAGHGSVPASYFAWPDSLNEVPIVDNSGAHVVHLQRTNLAPQSGPNFSITGAQIVQGMPTDGALAQCQVQIELTNTSDHSYFVSVYDFRVFDTDRRQFSVEPSRMVRVSRGLVGRWLKPQESLSGVIILKRRDAPIAEVVFQPDRYTRLVLSTPRG